MTLAKIPTLETERLHLRGFKADDFEDYFAIRSHPDNAKWLGSVKNRDDVWNHMAAVIGHWELRGYGRFCVVEKESGKIVGIIGFLNPPDWPAPEIGYVVAKPSQGKGYAPEAVRRCAEFGYQELEMTEIISMIDPENLPSQRVAAKLGATHTKQTFQNSGYTLDIWRYPPAGEFLKQKH